MRLARFIIGLVFFMGAIFKLQDPVGLELIMQNYFAFFHVSFLSGIAKAAGIAFALLEAGLGIMLTSRFYVKWVDRIAAGLIAFFTLLTLVLLIVNPDMHCGCFGKVIDLGHLGSFIKNIFLCLLAALAFTRALIPGKWDGDSWANHFQRIKAGVLAIGVILFTAYPLYDLPLKDFTAFKQGNTLAGATDSENAGRRQISALESLLGKWIKNDAPASELYFIYEKDGIQDKFTIDNLPDSTWTFVDTEQYEKSLGFYDEPVISVWDANEIYYDDYLVDGKGIIITLYKKPSAKLSEQIVRFISACSAKGINAIVISDQAYEGSPSDLFCDHRTLLSVNRANGGATYLSDGRIISKYSPRTYPSDEALDEILYEPAEAILLQDLTPKTLAYNFIQFAFVFLMII